MSNANEEPGGCEFCSHAFNRPDGNEPFVCPYCSRRWIGGTPQPDGDDHSETPR